MFDRKKITDKIRGRFNGIEVPEIRIGPAFILIVLVSIIIISSIIRIMPIKFGAYFTAFDPLFQYRVTRYITENGFKAYFTWHDTLSWYPMGRDIAHSSYLGVPFSGALMYFLLNALGLKVSIYYVCLFFPLFMAALSCIVIFFLAKDLGGKAAGLLASFFMAINPAFIGRTSLGFYDTENIGIFGLILTTLLFLRSIEKGKKTEYRIIYGISAGLSLGYIFISWGAARYAVGLIGLFIVAMLLIGKYELRYLTGYSLTLGVGLAIAMMAPRPGVLYPMSVENLAALVLVIVQLGYWYLKDRIDVFTSSITLGSLLFLVLLVVLVLPMLGIGVPIGGKFLNVINPFRESNNPLFESVAEHRVASWTTFFTDFGVTLILGLTACYFALNNLEEKKLFGMIFFITGIYFAGSMSRLMLILSIPASLMAAVGLVELTIHFKKNLKQREFQGRRRRRIETFGSSKGLGFIFLLLLLVAILPQIWFSASSANQPTALASSSIPLRLDGEFPKDWLQALSWMNDNLPDDAIVVSWWDYGYWIEAMANKTTLADGATRDQNQIANIAKMMMLPPEDSLPLFKKYNATHVLVFVTYNPNNWQESWPFGDNVKWQWMVRIGGFNESDFVSIDQQGQASFTENYFNSTLFGLMYGIVDAPYLRPAFASRYGFVKIYSIED
jgi:dolichyl-diphosphooligosaccharide--protein glycosyltransferase